MIRSSDISTRSKLTWYGDADFSTFMRRAFAKGMGLTDEDLKKPFIGICNSWSELNHCNSHLREVAARGQTRRPAGGRHSARVSDHLAR